MFTDQVNVNLE